MFPINIKFNNNNLENLSDQNNNSCTMNDLEAGLNFNPTRHLNKKMKKRKQLNALIKFRSNNRSSNDALISSEDELFLPDNKRSPTKSRSSIYHRSYNYIRNIISFCLVCIFMIACVGLGYANVELNSEVQNLSLRITEIEKRFSTNDIDRVVATLEQLKARLNLIERWNVTYFYERLQKLQANFNEIKLNKPSITNNDELDLSSKLNQIEEKSTQFSEFANELDKLSHDADNRAENMISDKKNTYDRNSIEQLLEQEKTKHLYQDPNQLLKIVLSLNETLYTNVIKCRDELTAFRHEIQNFNQTIKIEELVLHFQQLTNIVYNTSDKTSAIITIMQSDIEKLRNQITACKCLQEPSRLKPSIVEGNQLQQSLVTKPNPIDLSAAPTTTKSLEMNHNETNEEIAPLNN